MGGRQQSDRELLSPDSAAPVGAIGGWGGLGKGASRYTNKEHMLVAFSTATVLYGEQTLNRACREIASAGLSHVDLWHVEGWCEHLADGPERVVETLDRHALAPQAITAFRASPEQQAALLPVLQQLGGEVLITGSGPEDQSVDAFAEEIRPVVVRATELGVTLAIENHARACIDSIASMTELMELLPQSGLGIALAPIHLYNRDESTVDALYALRNRVTLFSEISHIKPD